jgi:hypothetical protein
MIKKSKPVKINKTTKTIPTTTEFIPRLLCYTNIDIDATSPLLIIPNLIHQSYSNIYFLINIFVNNKNEETLYKKHTKSLLDPSKIKINYWMKSNKDINNHLVGFYNFEHEKYNMFLYMHNNIYFYDYIKNVIKNYDHTKDINNIFCEESDTYNYIINNKVLDLLLKNKSHDFTSIITDFNLEINNITSKDVIGYYNSNTEVKETIESNTSESQPYYKHIENEFFAICIFEHNYWSSYIYLNKRNNRMYNIFNDDHGSFKIQNDQIIITWDTWGDEIFYKKNIDGSYYYSIHQ